MNQTRREYDMQFKVIFAAVIAALEGYRVRIDISYREIPSLHLWVFERNMVVHEVEQIVSNVCIEHGLYDLELSSILAMVGTIDGQFGVVNLHNMSAHKDMDFVRKTVPVLTNQ